MEGRIRGRRGPVGGDDRVELCCEELLVGAAGLNLAGIAMVLPLQDENSQLRAETDGART
jgi:hypothetical protein